MKLLFKNIYWLQIFPYDGFCLRTYIFSLMKYVIQDVLAIAKIVNPSALVDNFEHSTLSLIHLITTFPHKTSRRVIVLQKNAAFHDFCAINCNLLFAEVKKISLATKSSNMRSSQLNIFPRSSCTL